MAIVQDFYNWGGAHIRVNDDAYGSMSPEELERHRECVMRERADAVYNIVRNRLNEGMTMEELIEKIETHKARREKGDHFWWKDE